MKKIACGLTMVLGALVVGCAGPATGPALPQYVCEHGITFTAKLDDEAAVLNGARGREVLFRDAGGVTPTQAVYANARMRAEFGLGATGREAILRYPLLPLVARCVRD